jgi:hypothetical protein
MKIVAGSLGSWWDWLASAKNDCVQDVDENMILQLDTVKMKSFEVNQYIYK